MKSSQGKAVWGAFTLSIMIVGGAVTTALTQASGDGDKSRDQTKATKKAEEKTGSEADNSMNSDRAHPLLVNEEKTKQFGELKAAPWKEVFYDEGTDDWTRHWTLDGLKAKVSNSEKGMEYHAGPEIEDASHAVLWTKQSFEGDIRIDFEYTRLDTATRAVNIIYFHATGSGEGPYAKDISTWAHLREVPAMRTYFNNLNTYHVSYAANPGPEDYIRARRYIPGGGLQGTDLEPDYLRTGMFKTGMPHQFTLIKKGDDLFLQVRNTEKTLLCHWKTDTVPPLSEGRIGLRQMNTRSGLYRNFRVSSLPTKADAPPVNEPPLKSEP